jgi:exosortase
MAAVSLNDKWKISILLLAWAVLFYPVVPPMVETWISHSDNSHALLVPLISLYFFWQKREEIRSIPLSSSMWGWMILGVSLAVYLVSFAGGIAFLARMMMVSSLLGLLWCCLGTQMVRSLAFPLAFLVFMVPVPDSVLGMVSYPLQLMASKISVDLITLCSIPVYREGNMLFFLQTRLEVAEACSGIRSIMSLTMLSVIFAYLLQSGRWQKIVLVISALPIALLANIVRVTGTGILAHFFGDQVAQGFLHDFSGMAVFASGMVILYLEFQLLNRIGSKGKADG